MVDVVRILLTPIEEIVLSKYDRIAIVDSQPGTGNNSLPAGRKVDMVIDHHPLRAGEPGRHLVRRPFRAGRDSHHRAGVPARPARAHRFAHGHRPVLCAAHRRPATWAAKRPTPSGTRTCSWCRWSTTSRCRASRTPRCRANTSPRWTGPCARPGCGATWWPRTWASCPIPTWWPRWPTCCWASTSAKFVLCGGRFGTRAFLSLRTDASESRAGTLMREIIDSEGAAGGHGTMAGGRLHRPWPTTTPAGRGVRPHRAAPAAGGGRPEGDGRAAGRPLGFECDRLSVSLLLVNPGVFPGQCVNTGGHHEDGTDDDDHRGGVDRFGTRRGCRGNKLGESLSAPREARCSGRWRRPSGRCTTGRPRPTIRLTSASKWTFPLVGAPLPHEWEKPSPRNADKGVPCCNRGPSLATLTGA